MIIVRSMLFTSAGCIALAAVQVQAAAVRADQPAAVTPANAAAPGNAENANDENEMHEIIVTAFKRSENVQSVPATVSVVGGDMLIARGVNDLRAVTAFVPSVNFNQEGGVTQVFIRGIGQTSDAETNDPAVATNIDGVYASRFTLGGSLFDVERVEVLYGPQGTLYGRNAAGGAVNITTKLPKFQAEGEGLLEYGNFDYIHGFAAASLPVTQNLAIRMAFDAAKRDGFVSNGTNDLDTIAGRVTILYKPDSALSLVVRAEYQKGTGKGSTLVLRPYLDPSDPYFQRDVPSENFYDNREAKKVSAELNYDIGGPSEIQVTYIPAYTRYSFNISSPVGYTSRYYPNPGVAGNPLTGFAATLTSQDKSHINSHELRVAGKTGPLQWLVGGYYFDQVAGGAGASFNIYNPAVFTGGSSLPHAFESGGPQNHIRVNTGSRALFGQATFSFSDTFRITGGLRYSRDRRHAVGRAQSLIPIAGIALPAISYDLRLKDDRVDWKLGFEFDVAPSSMLYANYQTGYIGGGFNVTAATATATTFRPEVVKAYTAGIKNTLFDRRLRLNAELFYYNYRDLQVSAYNAATGAALLYNVPKSEIYGAQVEASLYMDRGFTADASVGYLHTKIKDGTLPPAAVYACGAGSSIPAQYCSANNLIDYSGLSLPNSPKLSASLSISKNWDISNGGKIGLSVGGNYQSSSWALFSHLKGLHRASYAKADTTLTYRAPGDIWSISAWVKNITDVTTYVTPATTNVYGLNTWFLDAPRTYGLRLAFKI